MSSTINTQDCRKVVRVAWDAPESLFEIPDGLDLEDESVVEEWWVKWNTLHIKYVGKKEVEEIEPCQETELDYKRPQECEIESADDMGYEY